MNAITCLGLLPPRSLRLAHFAILLQIPRDPSPFESLPTEIITHIAEIAQDTHIAEQAKKPREGGTCPCCERETEGRHIGVADSVVALGGTSRRVRAILVNAGFFRTISRQVIADELFSSSVEATDGFLDNADIVALRVSYRDPENRPIDTANLRRALDLYTGAVHMYFHWDTTLAAPSKKPLPTLPPTRSTLSIAPKPSNLRTLTIGLADHTSHEVKAGEDSRPLITDHMHQLLPVVVPPGLQELDLALHYNDADITVRDGFFEVVDSFRGMKWEGLKRLGITMFYDVDEREQVSEAWLPTLETLLRLVPGLSSTLTDLDIVFNVRIGNSTVFVENQDAEPNLSGLIPLRHQLVELLRRLEDANIELRPFTVVLMSDCGLLPMSTTIFLLEYIPQSYNTPKGRKLLPERMRSLVDPKTAAKLMGAPETRKVLGGDDLRFAVNDQGILDMFVDVLGMERLRDPVIPVIDAEEDDEDEDWEDEEFDMREAGLPPALPPPLRAIFEEMMDSFLETL